MKTKSKAKSTKKLKPKKKYPKTSGDTLVNQKMLYKVRDELKSDIQGLEHRMEARFNKIDARFSEIDARFNKIDARFSEIDARFNKMEARFNEMDAKIDVMNSKIERMLLLFEEQNNRNKVVLDGLSNLFERQERLEKLIAPKEI